MSKIGMPLSKSKDILPNPINIILILRSKVKVIELINVRDTSYHGDTLTYPTKYDYVKGQKS